MKGILGRLAKLFRREPLRPPPIVRTSEDGLEVIRCGETLASVRWRDVRKIITYKYDLFSTDEICVGFFTDEDADTWLEISEEWKGFLEAVEMMERWFPSIPRNWFNEVMVPAFERKETVLYESGHEVPGTPAG